MSGLMTLWPTRKLLMLRGGWRWRSGRSTPVKGRSPRSRRRIHPRRCRALAPRSSICTHRAPSASTGGLRPITLDAGDSTPSRCTTTRTTTRRLGFRQLDYEVVQHFPILRETWAISLRGLAQTTMTKSGQEIPFFLLPSLGGGHNMKGYESYRFRDRNSLLLQGEWRIMVNRFMDTALFYDAGKGRDGHRGSRPQRTDARLRRRRPFSLAVLHDVSRRSGPEP